MKNLIQQLLNVFSLKSKTKFENNKANTNNSKDEDEDDWNYLLNLTSL